MLGKIGGIAVTLLGGLLVSSACSSSSDSSSGETGGMGGHAAGEAGAGGANAGETSNGGGDAGAAGSAGTTDQEAAGAPGSSGTAGSDAGSGGAAEPSGGTSGSGGTGGTTGGTGGTSGTGGQASGCSPTADQCPDGSYCTAERACVPGCKNDAISGAQNATGCASGICATGHECRSCLTDNECTSGRVCGDNQCAAACTVAQEGTHSGCGAGLTCCSSHCVDAGSDSQHCGVCGTACSTGEFCGLTACATGADPASCVACQGTTLANLCSIAKVAVVIDNSSGNPAIGRAIGAALTAQCHPAPTVREVNQSTSDALNATSGQPVSGGDELLVVAGGNFYQNVLKYTDGNPISAIYPNVENSTTLQFIDRATHAVVASEPYAENTSSDQFVLQFIRDPKSGSLILNAQGFWQRGTQAAEIYLEQVILPALAPSTFTKSWYVYQWTDLNGDMTPGLNEITLIAAAP